MAHVLIIDSDPLFVRIYKDVIQRAGHVVDSCASIAEVYEILKRVSPDVAFIELSLGGGDGVALGEVVKRRNAAAQIVGMGTTNESRLMSNAARMGVTDYLQKPIEAEFMLATLGRVLDRNRALNETNRLVDENVRHFAQQRAFKDGLVWLRTLDEAALFERILEIATPHTRCQGLALYVSRGGAPLERVGYKGLLAEDALPETLPDIGMLLDTAPQSVTLPLDQPLRLGGNQLPKVVAAEKARGLMLVFATDGRIEGALVGTARTGHPFDATDIARTQLLAEVGAVSLVNARRFSAEQKKSTRSARGRLLSMRFFVEALGKELHKARRYHRRFALVEITIDGYADIPKSAREPMNTALTALLEKFSRDADTVARASENEFLLLLPETDLGGTRKVMSRIEEGIAQDATFAAVQVTVGGACFPNDGNDVDALLSASRRRIDEARASPLRQMQLEPLDFWAASDKLLADESPLRDPITASVDSTFATFTPAESLAVARELILARAGRPEHKANIYVGVPELTADLVLELSKVLPPSWKQQVEWLTLIGADDGRPHDNIPGIKRVHVDAELSTRLGYVLSIDAASSYALIGTNLHSVPGEAFHTADYRLALGLTRKLQTALKLERWL